MGIINSRSVLTLVLFLLGGGRMFALGQVIAILVCGLLFGLIVQSQGKKKGKDQIGNIGLASSFVSVFVGGVPLGLLSMAIFLLIINFG
jgi:hypothetical protein